jgi:tripartite-type tricarboxylate transporter receptor subunit TctC
MTIKQVSAVAAAAICFATAMATPAACADDYPSRPVTMVVPLAPGGSTDTLGRIIAQGMRPTLGQPVVVENTAGAAGTIGVTRAARAAPDGYTVLWGMWGTNVANGAIYALDFDLLNDFAPVALVATQPFLIDARKTMPANNLKELIAWLKANTDKATMGTSGVGSPSHVAGVLMEQLVGVKWQMISYRSAGLATQDLLAGITDIQLDTPAVSLTHVRSGDLKAYAGPPNNASRSRRRFPPPTKRGCRDSISRFGTLCGRRKARRSRSSPSSTPRSSPRLRTRTRARSSSTLRKRFIRASSRRPKGFMLFKKAKWRSGGQSSGPPASKPNKRFGAAHDHCGC